jgi:hypothetical protein
MYLFFATEAQMARKIDGLFFSHPECNEGALNDGKRKTG